MKAAIKNAKPQSRPAWASYRYPRAVMTAIVVEDGEPRAAASVYDMTRPESETVRVAFFPDWSRPGYGVARGYGYHKQSAALADALRNAGVELSENIAGVGKPAMEAALVATVSAALWVEPEAVHVIWH